MPASLPPEVRASVRALIDYLWRDEHNDWMAAGRPKNHIFNDVHAVERWLADQEDYAPPSHP